MTDELKAKKDHYVEVDELGDEFCKAVNCNACFGTDFNGEPNGYGCDEREAFIDRNESLLLDIEDAYTLVKGQLEKKQAEIDELVEVIQAEIDSMGYYLVNSDTPSRESLRDSRNAFRQARSKHKKGQDSE